MREPERPLDQETGQEPEPKSRLPYAPPKLHEYGQLSELVQYAPSEYPNEAIAGSWSTF